ncbi:MAG: FAD-dependent oxidoreductase [Burkholderiaceae bacterium]
MSVAPALPDAVDLIVLGGGATGLTAAVTGALLGLEVLVVEKAPRVGGTSARSAGSVWVPNTRHAPAGSDDPDKARRYLQAVLGDDYDPALMTAFLQGGPEMIAFLEDRAGVPFRAYAHHPDYMADADGASLSGRVLEVPPFDGRALGARFVDLAWPLPEFTIFGGMMVDRTDIGHLLSATRRLASFMHAARLLGRHARDRIRHARGTRLVMGNALVGRLFDAALRSGVRFALSTRIESLLLDAGRVCGVRTGGGARRAIGARAGVILATGGFSRDPALRASLLPAQLGKDSALVETATGDGLHLAEAIGGHLRTHRTNTFWAPVSQRRRRDGSMAVFPHFVLDRGKPGVLAIDPAGKRFVNEAWPYHLFGQAICAALARHGGGRCHLICDDPFIERYGLGTVRPGRLGLRAAQADGYVISADSLEALAARIAVPADALQATVARFNRLAESGEDVDFGKGGNAYQRNLGDAGHAPNPCLGPLASPPLHALVIHPGDIGASAGLACDTVARVLDGQGDPVAGLYACGNDMASVMAGHYPGPGITLGPGMTFAYIAARHAHDRQRAGAVAG